MSSSSSIAERVREAGIVGAGGAGFPTHVKFGAKVETVIANGAECEPLLRCDKAVMRERTEDVLRGLSLLAEATGAARVVIALKAHYADVVGRVREVAQASFPDIEVFELGNYYPAGDEQVLVNAVTGRVVPEGGIPLQVSAVVSNVITLSQVARAVDLGLPVTRRPLTVGGDVRRPLTCELPIGAPMSLAVELAGGPAVDGEWVIIEGGPMMGRLVEDSGEPVTKKTSGVIVLPADHPLVLSKRRDMDREVLLTRAACCQCRVCTDLCPRANLGHAIQPHLAMRAVSSWARGDGLPEGWDPPPEQITAAYLCCLCGVCEVYACPMGLSPRKVFDQMRASLIAAGQKSPHHRDRLTPNDFIGARRVPLPRLIARLDLTARAAAPDRVDWRTIAVPRVCIPLSQHTGAPAGPVVRQGQTVGEGELIAEIPDDKLGARMHASIGGRVTRVDENEICIEAS